MSYKDSRMGSSQSLAGTTQRDLQISIDRRYLVPATAELIQLNNKWQYQIKGEKERRRNACIIASMQNNFTEQNDIENQTLRAIDADTLSTFDNVDEPLTSICNISVTKISMPSQAARNDIVQRFTLNKNQKAAFMIITGHLDGMDNINAGNMIK